MNQTPIPDDFTPERLAAWADGELPADEAGAAEAWLAARPEARREAEALRQVTRLYREQAPAPSADRWREAFARIESRVRPASSARWRLVLGVAVASAAALGAVALARALWPGAQPPLVERVAAPDDEPYAVASAAEVHIIGVDAGDADRIVTGQPMMGPLEFVGLGEVDVVEVEPDAEDGTMPRLERRGGMPVVVIVAKAEEIDP